MMRKYLLIGIAGFSVFLASGLATLWDSRSEAELFAQSCEVVLKKRLYSPENYRRIGRSDITRSNGDLDDFLESPTTEKVVRRIKKAATDSEYGKLVKRQSEIYHRGNLERVSIQISFVVSSDAGELQLSFRDTVECSDYIDKGSNWSDRDDRKPRIDGESALRWAELNPSR